MRFLKVCTEMHISYKHFSSKFPEECLYSNFPFGIATFYYSEGQMEGNSVVKLIGILNNACYSGFLKR